MNLREAAEEKLLIVAHRGAFGGNIPCNTLAAYEIALKQGADMIEIDVEMSRDGGLYVFHPGMEPHHLGCGEYIRNMTGEEISRLRYLNYDRTPTQFGINTLDEVLESFSGRCFINIDKFWGHPREIYEAVLRHGMTDRVLVKSTLNEDIILMLMGMCPEVPFMPVVRDSHPMHERLLSCGINYVGAEVLFAGEDCEVASCEFIEKMHRDRTLVFANSIVYDHREQLAAGHSDDTSLCSHPDEGWGWLADRGFDLIQTDWCMMLSEYLKKKGLLYRNNVFDVKRRQGLGALGHCRGQGTPREERL